MPGVAQKINACGASDGTVYHNSLARNGPLPSHSSNGSSVSSNGFWSKQRDDTSYNQLQKFWCELTTQARQKLMRIDKQTLFEHARKNMYCSRCNGLLLEGFLQIVLYGKSLQQQDAASSHYSGQGTINQNCGTLCNDNEYQNDVMDPSIHPWGGLTTSRDGTLTLLDCYIHSNSLKALQNVFDSARARERERKLLYPDACGEGGRGWTGYGRGHGTRESCALHTAHLSVETLVDFWCALGEETRQSLLRMKEEDFIERLMFRFDSKRFCRDCRRNVIREFKELKELKRMRKDPHCTSWFCVADSVFQYEVSHDTVQADWHQMFLDACGTYHHFEWAIGTGEGKSDILDFKNVGLSVRVKVNGLDLSGLNACYITLRAWKMDGRCNELCVKAHALRGQQCVHCRLAVGDGYVAITIGENIRRFFEQAEEAEEEEDDDSMDKDGNELDGECSRPQKHAKSPELAREFLLDAATVIFKEQVGKAFREGTARQNAHSIFVCLALKLLEERVHVACKEIATLEKQMKLLEEEEREKREEEDRKERRRIKEREKKLRRKERLREKENKEKKCAESNRDVMVLDTRNEEKSRLDESVNIGKAIDFASETGEATPTGSPLPPDAQDEQFLMGCISPNMENHQDNVNTETCGTRDFNTSLTFNHYRYSRGKPRLHKDTKQDLTLKWSDMRKGSALSESELATSKYEPRFQSDGFESTRGMNCSSKQPRSTVRVNTRNGPKLSEKLQCTNNRVGGGCDSRVCSCNYQNDYRARSELRIMRSTQDREPKYVNKLESSCDLSKSYYREKCNQVECTREVSGRVKTNSNSSNSPATKKVWEPLDSQKKYGRSNSVALNSKVKTTEPGRVPESFCTVTSSELTDISVETNGKGNEQRDLIRSGNETCRDTENGFQSREKSENHMKVEEAEDAKSCFMAQSLHRTVDSLLSSSSNSDNCSSCLSEGDSNTSSNRQNLESTSTSDSEESSQTSDILHCLENGFTECDKVVNDHSTMRLLNVNSQEPATGAPNSVSSLPTETASYCESVKANGAANVDSQSVLASMTHNQSMQYPVYQVPAMGYYHQGPVSWPAGPTNGLMPYHYSNYYLFANGFGYDMNTNQQLMQYGGLQHLPPPSINPVHVPAFSPLTRADVVCKEDQACPGVVKEVHRSIQTVGSAERHFGETQKVVDGVQNGTSDTDFSLFHFGGPVALSAGLKAEAVALERAAPSEKGCCCIPDGNSPCNRKDSIEEYNLFAASNGIKFSIL